MGKFLISIITVIVVGAILFLFRIGVFFPSGGLEKIGKLTDTALQDVKKEIISPPPLRILRESQQALLTQAGTVKWTNIQRVNNSLAPLAENIGLNSAAVRKVQDMFNRQYFEHISPDGKNVGNLVEDAGYEYIAVGENLALGNYKDDQGLVQAWMDSPGHRANILNPRFREIGIAVGRGLFEGKQTWLAVQTFALPLTACPQPEETLKSQINWLELQITELKIRAEGILSEFERYNKKDGREEYNSKVEEYNVVVQQLNELITQVKNLVLKYNDQARTFNVCVANL